MTRQGGIISIRLRQGRPAPDSPRGKVCRPRAICSCLSSHCRAATVGRRQRHHAVSPSPHKYKHGQLSTNSRGLHCACETPPYQQDSSVHVVHAKRVRQFRVPQWNQELLQHFVYRPFLRAKRRSIKNKNGTNKRARCVSPKAAIARSKETPH